MKVCVILIRVRNICAGCFVCVGNGLFSYLAVATACFLVVSSW